MTIKIDYLSKANDKITANTVLFVDDKYNINNIQKHVTNSDFDYIKDLLKNSDLKKNILVFEINSKKKIFFISIKKNLKNVEIENLGAEFYNRINYGKKSEYFINSVGIIEKRENFIGHFLHGVKLKSYEFKKYKTKNDQRIIEIKVVGKHKHPR